MKAVHRHKVYLLDANVFIEAHRRYYAMDLTPGYWAALVHYIQEGQVRSIDRVRDELATGDSLEDWTKPISAELFLLSATADTVIRYGEMIDWVESKTQFTDAAKNEFAQVADGWLAAHASTIGATLVSHESRAPDAKKRVPLPDLCDEFGVTVYSTFDMLRELQVKLELDPSSC